MKACVSTPSQKEYGIVIARRRKRRRNEVVIEIMSKCCCSAMISEPHLGKLYETEIR